MNCLTYVLSMLKYVKRALLAVGLISVVSCGDSTLSPTAPTGTSPATSPFQATSGQVGTLDHDDDDDDDRDDDDDDDNDDDDDDDDEDNPSPPNTPPTPTPPPPTGTRITFIADIQPILAADCVRCHSGLHPAAERDYTTYAGVMQVVMPGSANSRIVRMTQPNGAMFQNLSGTLAERLQKAETIRRWVVEFAAAEQ